MTTASGQELEREIRQIMYDRITTVSEELHEKGLRWGDMFSEEDNRAIETFTIETVGESAQEAAEREERRREMDRKRMEMVARYNSRKKLSQTEEQTKIEPCEESEVVPDDPIPQSASVKKDPDKTRKDVLEEEPVAGSSSREQIDDDRIPWHYRRNNLTMEYERHQHYYRRSNVWRSNRINHTSVSGNWRHSHSENQANSNRHRPYYGRGGWKGYRDRHLRGHARWSDERSSHPPVSEEQGDRPHNSFTGDRDISFRHRHERNRIPWHRAQHHNRSYHH